tara:strand:+ start:3953 stop:4678 length:726 start_codon:yes stop_codon:yes gene_type:complete
MKQAIQIATYVIGSATLLGGSFFLFAALSGTPLRDISGVGDMFPGEEVDPATVSQDVPTIDEQLLGDRRGSDQVFLEAASPLRAFVLENPFSSGELEMLEQRLEMRMEEVNKRSRDLDKREAQVIADKQQYDRLFNELENLRNQLIQEKDELINQRAEAERDEEALDEKQKAAWKAVAALFEEGKASTQAQMLIDGYSPKEAGLVLAQLETERVRELLAAVHKIDTPSYEAMEKAWRAAIR